ncbi:MAG: electron transfer flavoprotein beta subunit/FixA family protein, partial [Spirochaetaceae bacterium]|nr:electron transfer flavoprotein beta subunit/FixA family protein [Spirochaetaceae bacterium]
VFCGRQAIDGDTAQVGPQTAEKLGINQITNVSAIESIDVKKKELQARRSIEGGYEIIKAPFPLLLTVTDEGYFPRPPSVIRVMTYKNASAEMDEAEYDESYINSSVEKSRDTAISLWDINAIGADVESCGLAGSPTKVKKIESVILKSKEIRMVENSEESISEMVHDLIADHTLG